MFDLKGHIRSNKALYVYIFSSNNSSVQPLFSLFASLSFFSLSLFTPPPLPSTPLHRRYNHTTAAADIKNLRGNSCSPSLSSSLLLLLSLYASLSFLSLSLSFFSSLSSTPSTPISALYPPYASLSLLSPSFFFSLFLTLTYVLMDNFLSLFSLKVSTRTLIALSSK